MGNRPASDTSVAGPSAERGPSPHVVAIAEATRAFAEDTSDLERLLRTIVRRVTDLVGDWWTPLVLREAFMGARRFDEFQTRLGAPRAVLAARFFFATVQFLFFTS